MFKSRVYNERAERSLVAVRGAKNCRTAALLEESVSPGCAANGRRASGRHCRWTVSFGGGVVRSVCCGEACGVASGVLCWIFYLFISGYLVFYTRRQRICTPQDNVSVSASSNPSRVAAKTPVNTLERPADIRELACSRASYLADTFARSAVMVSLGCSSIWALDCLSVVSEKNVTGGEGLATPVRDPPRMIRSMTSDEPRSTGTRVVIHPRFDLWIFTR